MIEIDYELKRIESDGTTRSFHPDSKLQHMNNLSYIEGPNSSGKSTVLNIIALAFFGLKNPSVNHALLNKMKSLLNTERHELTFRVKITDKKGIIVLEASKDDPTKNEIIVTELPSKKTLTNDTFDRKYHLIYDIPENPTERLKEIVNEIRADQTRYANGIGGLKECVSTLITDIQNSKDPKHIAEVQLNIKKCLSDNEEAKKLFQQHTKERDLFENYIFAKLYDEYRTEVKKIADKLENIRTQQKRVEKKSVRANKDFSDRMRLAEQTVSVMQQSFDKISRLLKLVLLPNEKHLLKIWERIDLRQAVTQYELEPRFEEQLVQYKRLLLARSTDLESKETTKEASLYKELIQLLEHYELLSIELPGIKMNIKDFINVLRKDEQRYASDSVILENIKNTLRLIEELNARRVGLVEILAELKQLTLTHKVDDSLIKFESGESQEKELNAVLKEKSKKLQEYYGYYVAKKKPDVYKMGIEGKRLIQAYAEYTEEQLLQKLTELRRQESSQQERHISLKSTCARFEEELNMLKKKKEHPYQKYFNELTEFSEKLNILDRRFRRDFVSYLDAIITQKAPAQQNLEQLKYNDAVFKFLGMRLGSFRHINKYYTAIAVNLIQQCIETEEGKKIYLDEMGTGQSQSVYLKSLLDRAGEKQVIAMFDEIAMMDEESLRPVLNKLHEKFDNQKLLLGLVVQKALKLKVGSLPGKA